jgi:hypothetical protein
VRESEIGAGLGDYVVGRSRMAAYRGSMRCEILFHGDVEWVLFCLVRDLVRGLLGRDLFALIEVKMCECFCSGKELRGSSRKGFRESSLLLCLLANMAASDSIL